MSTDSPGWRPDPTGEHQHRYWDGEQWTDRVTDDAVASTTRDPVATDREGAEPSWPGREPGWSPAAAGRQVGRVVRKAPSARLLAAAGLTAVAVVVGVVVLVIGGDGTPSAEDERSGDGPDPVEGDDGVATEALRKDMRIAAAELESTDTFAFDAVVVVPWPPDAVLAVDEGIDLTDRFELSGEVILSAGLVRQRGGPVDSFGSGAEERVAVGDEAWRRSSAFPEVLDEVPWIPEEDVPEPFPPREGGYVIGSLDNVPGAFDPRFLPRWLAAATDHEDGGTDDGHLVIRAQVPDRDVPGAERRGDAAEPTLSDASVEVTVDPSGPPRRVVITATVNGAEARAEYDLAVGGEPFRVVVPTPEDFDPLPTVPERDIAFAREITAGNGTPLSPMGLTAPPEGWQFVRAHVTDSSNGDRTRCPPDIGVSYGNADAWLSVSVRPSSSPCSRQLSESSPVTASGDEIPIESSPITAGGHDGTIFDLPDAATGAGLSALPDQLVVELTIDDMSVSVFTDGVPEAELAEVLASLGPIDPSEQAERSGSGDRSSA